MSYYSKIIEFNNSELKPFWQYNLPENFLSELKDYFGNKSYLFDVDPRDCAIYYALWWKNEYKEGSPSKELVFNSFNNAKNKFDAIEFFDKAKEGGRGLNFKWIKKERTLYFKTLLIQGGLPLKSLERFRGQYREFLSRVIELQPKQIEDIANEFSLINLLPISTRNDAIYETCLNISNAIWNDEEEGKAILNILESSDSELVLRLKQVKSRVSEIQNTSVKVRVYWELIKDVSTTDISLKIDLPDKINGSQLQALFDIENSDNEYKFFCDDILVMEYRKNLKGDFIKYYTSSSAITWEPKNDKLPLLYFSNANGKRYFIKEKITITPSTTVPSMWRQMEENRWVMIQSRNCAEDSAYILSTNELLTSDYFDKFGFTLNEESFYFFEIKSTLKITLDDEEPIYFNLKTKSFSWTLEGNKPSWIEKSNHVVVRTLPKVHFYSYDSKKIEEKLVVKEWRQKGTILWKPFANSAIPVGIIEFRFTYQNISEYDKVFNIGNSNVTFPANQDITMAKIQKQGFSNLDFKILDSELYNSISEQDLITLKFKDPLKLPTRLKAEIHSNFGALLFDFLTPLNGIALLDNDDNIVPEGHTFLLGSLNGYRILSYNESKEQHIKIHNPNHAEIKIQIKLSSQLVPLRNFESNIQKLFYLYEVMSPDNEIIIELENKNYKVKLYNNQVSVEKEENGKVKLKLEHLLDNKELYAIPIECDINQINVITLHESDNGFCFSKQVESEKFIVFNRSNVSSKILPCYVSSNPDDIETTPENKLERLENSGKILANCGPNDESWNKLFRYLNLCREYDLPFSTFDILRGVCTNSDNAAKLFFYIVCNFADKIEFVRICERLENELGFRFHWISYSSFSKAFEWVCEAYGMSNPRDIQIIYETATQYVDAKYLEQGGANNNLPKDFHLKSEIKFMRERLGERAIRELPFGKPRLTSTQKEIIRIDSDSNKLKIMARTPVAVALLKLDKYIISEWDLWHPSSYKVRRNMMYCENLDPEWYTKAIAFTFTKIS